MLHVAYRSTLSRMADDMRERDRTWIADILRQQGWTATDLARRAGISQTTLTRFLNDPDHAFQLSTRTRNAIARSIGLLPSVSSAPVPPPRVGVGFYEPDAVPLEDVHATLEAVFAGILKSAIASHPHAAAFVLRSRKLEALGYRAGDALIVDINATPRPGDLVCAQVYDWPRNAAETVFRIYQPPFLLAGPGPDGVLERPLVVDGQTILVRGVVMFSIRPRSDVNKVAA